MCTLIILRRMKFLGQVKNVTNLVTFRRYGITDIFKTTPISFGEYQIVTPGIISDIRSVPEKIPKPIYHETGDPGLISQKIDTKSDDEIIEMKSSCILAANILQHVEEIIKVGMTTEEIDVLVHNLSIEHNAYPAPLNYKNFPKSVCTSVNNVACHGIPDDRKLIDGDIVNVDITVYKNGYFGDCSKTFLVGNVDKQGVDLVHATETCLQEAIDICKPGVPFRNIGRLIEQLAKKQGYKVLPLFCGHGIGTYFHGPPDIYHCSNYYPGNMQPGMTFTIEPVIGQGSDEINILDDGWTCITVDGSRTAQTEHTVLITENGALILTQPDVK